MFAPNPRLQRTRMRAPLSRKPLGDGNRYTASVLGLVVLSALGCSSHNVPDARSADQFLECPTPPPARQPMSDIVPPRLISGVPDLAAVESGLVCIEGTIGVDGLVHDVKITRSGGPTLDKIALESMKQRRYAPATRAGAAAEVPLAISLRFTRH